MHHRRSVIISIVRSLPLHRVVEHLQSSLYSLVIIRSFVKLVQRVLRGRGRGEEGLWYTGEIAELVCYIEKCYCSRFAWELYCGAIHAATYEKRLVGCSDHKGLHRLQNCHYKNCSNYNSQTSWLPWQDPLPSLEQRYRQSRSGRVLCQVQTQQEWSSALSGTDTAGVVECSVRSTSHTSVTAHTQA